MARGIGDRVPLTVVECPDRRLVRAASELALGIVVQDRAEVTVLLPRRTFRRLSQRLLHDRTADRIATALGRIPHVSATIVPFDTTLFARSRAPPRAKSGCRGRRAGATVYPRANRLRRQRGGCGGASCPRTGHRADRRSGLEATGDRGRPDQDGPGRHGRWKVAGSPGLRRHRRRPAAVLRAHPHPRHRAGRCRCGQPAPSGSTRAIWRSPTRATSCSTRMMRTSRSRSRPDAAESWSSPGARS